MKLSPVNLLIHGILGALALTATLAGCGGDTSGSRFKASGGATAAGGTGGLGGLAGMGGSIATGGVGGTAGSATGGATSSSMDCSAPFASPVAQITDFSDYDTTSGKWGTVGGLRGPIYSYQGDKAGQPEPKSTAVASFDKAAVDFSFKATVQPEGYVGCGLQFDGCATVAAFKGVEFTLAGTYGGCTLEFQVGTYSQKATKDGGGCVGDSCYNYPKVASVPEPTAGAVSTVKVLFADMVNWTPAAAVEVVALQWQVNGPGPGAAPCGIDLHIDNVKFVTE